ncbi:MAG: LysR family glycine cleavage system transcriptional activator [Oceanospirillaceae bacterium]|jgi:LysR family glycine cleavage system transcriptional activator
MSNEHSTKINLYSLPPLKSLKGFEAAARLLSIRGAAQELNLTHPAVTHQIQILESSLNVKLFSKQGRNIVLTADGETFYPYVREAMETLISGTQAMSRAVMSRPLRIQVYVTTSIRWLAPRLADFRAKFPEINLQLMTCNVGWEFDADNADIGLIFNNQPLKPQFHWCKLFDSQLFPVCSPLLIKDQQALNAVDLLDYPLITVYTEGWSWQQWFEEFCNPADIEQQLNANKSIVIDTLAVALEMAIKGEGIALVNGPSADDDLHTGRLIKPVDNVVSGLGEWGVICRNDIKDDKRVVLFIQWLKAEAAKRDQC